MKCSKRWLQTIDVAIITKSRRLCKPRLLFFRIFPSPYPRRILFKIRNQTVHLIVRRKAEVPRIPVLPKMRRNQLAGKDVPADGIQLRHHIRQGQKSLAGNPMSVQMAIII